MRKLPLFANQAETKSQALDWIDLTMLALRDGDTAPLHVKRAAVSLLVSIHAGASF